MMCSPFDKLVVVSKIHGQPSYMGWNKFRYINYHSSTIFHYICSVNIIAINMKFSKLNASFEVDLSNNKDIKELLLYSNFQFEVGYP